MSYDEQLPQPVRPGENPPQCAPSRTGPPTGVRRGRWLTPRLVFLPLMIILLGIAAGVITARAIPATNHEARAEILYVSNEAQQGGDPLRQDRQLSAQLMVLKSQAVLGPVAQKQGRQYDDLQNDIDVSVANNVILVKAFGATNLAAMQTLQAVIDGYLALTSLPTGTTGYLETQLANAKANTQQLQARVYQLTTAVLEGTASQASLNDARAQLQSSLDQERAIQMQVNEARLAGRTGFGAQVLTPPYSLPVRPNPLRPIATSIGPSAGLLLAGVILAISVRRTTARGTRAGRS